MSTSHGRIIRSTSIIGGASALNLLISLIRTKIAAVILGPVGIGLVGIFHSLITTAASLAAWSIANVTTRLIAEASDDAAAMATVRAAIVRAAAALALAGTAVVFLLRERIAGLVLDDPALADQVGWLSLGVGLLVVTYAQNGLLTGMRRIGDLARVSVGSALLATAAGVGALLLWREGALLFFVIVSPVATLLVGSWYVAKLPRRMAPPPPVRKLVPHWRILASLGLAFTIASVASTAAELVVRSLVQRDLGPVALGHFQASWVISANYIGFILVAMTADYYPRLTATIGEPQAAQNAVNEQAEVSLLLAGPLLLAMVGLSPWIIPLLYSSEFLPAVDMLRWQIVGDLPRIAAWPLSIILLASGKGRAFAAVMITAGALLVAASAVAIPLLGLEGVGIAYLVLYTGFLPVYVALARRMIGFVPSRSVLEAFAAIAAALAVTVALSFVSQIAGAVAGVLFASLVALLAVRRLHHALPAPVAAALSALRPRAGSRE